jgi:copper oxidase (laccase) domain-containing protein
MAQNQALILRDQKGDFYVISAEAVEAGKVPAAKAEQLKSALGSEVSGYGFFFSPDIQNAFTNVNQNNTNVGFNTAVGGIIGVNNQSLTQLGVNQANVGTVQNQ